MKMKRYDIIPLILLIYTLAMAAWGRDQFTGSRWEFAGIIGANLLVIVLLRFALKRRDKFRREMKESNARFAREKAEREKSKV